MSTSVIYSDPSISNPSINKALIHPLVIFKIADHYLRRGKETKKGETTEKDPEYCVGLLLGEKLNDEAIIRDIVPLKCFQEQEAELKSRAYVQHHSLYPNEKILGWYAFSANYVDFPSLIAEGADYIHLWMRPYLTPKVDVFSIRKAESIISIPIQYKIEANIPEQLALSKLDNVSSINGLINLLKSTQEKVKTHNDTTEFRMIHAALAQAKLNAESEKTLEESLKNITNFSNVLEETNKSIDNVEQILSIQYKEY